MRPENLKFYALLRELKTGEGRAYTVGILAREIGVNADHLNRVINHAPPGKGNLFGNIGGKTRVMVAAYLQRSFPTRAALLLASLHWDERGEIVEQGQVVPCGTRHVS